MATFKAVKPQPASKIIAKVAAAKPVKATKVTAEHLWSNNAKVTPQKAGLFNGAKNTTTPLI